MFTPVFQGIIDKGAGGANMKLIEPTMEYDKQIQAMSMTGAEPEPEAEDMTMGGM